MTCLLKLTNEIFFRAFKWPVKCENVYYISWKISSNTNKWMNRVVFKRWPFVWFCFKQIDHSDLFGYSWMMNQINKQNDAHKFSKWSFNGNSFWIIQLHHEKRSQFYEAALLFCIYQSVNQLRIGIMWRFDCSTLWLATLLDIPWALIIQNAHLRWVESCCWKEFHRGKTMFTLFPCFKLDLNWLLMLGCHFYHSYRNATREENNEQFGFFDKFFRPLEWLS